MSKSIDGVNLFDLPEWVDREKTIGFGDVGLEKYQLLTGELNLLSYQHLSKVGHIVKRVTSDVLTLNHRIEREDACALISDQSEIVRVGLRDSVYWHAVHPR